MKNRRVPAEPSSDVDRPGGRVVLLLAGPAGAWEQVRPAVARFVRSIRLL